MTRLAPKMWGGLATAALLCALSLPGSAQAAGIRPAGVTQAPQAAQATEVSSQRRHWRRHRHWRGPRVVRRYYGPRYYGPRYYAPYAYAPYPYYYRPYRSYYRYGWRRPGVSFSFGF